jgi:DNA-binding MarR family transcriptional regulator
VLLSTALFRGTLLKNKIGSRTRIRKLPRIVAAEKAVAAETMKGDFAEKAAHILTLDNFFKNKLNSPALRPAARLLLHIAVNRSVSIKQAMLDSPLSYRAFYIMIDRLKDAALLEVKSDHEDRRVRRLVLGAQFHKVIRGLPAYSSKHGVKIEPVI